jgi:arginase
MGAGPLHLLEHGVADLVAERGGDVAVATVESDGEWRAEIATTFTLAGAVARHVHAARTAGRFPVVLSGNCAASLGAVAGLTRDDVDDLGIVWLDAHGDLNTPETTTSGFLDGMALAALTGRCWQAMTARLPGFRALADRRVLLAGTRDLDPAERALLDASAIRSVPAGALGEGLTAAFLPALAALRDAGVRRVYLHVDVDVHDPAHAPANAFPAPGGPSPDDVRVLVRLVAKVLAIAGLGISAYDPAVDPAGVTRAVAMRLVDEVVTLASE